ncbi:MAG: hypothetical protein QOI54_3191 [Actinomycetota bacterium]|jgi:hypothetical protein|nr:hypothetical protein [Actinomycetota bacterium]
MPMLARLWQIAHDETKSDAVQLAAVRDWLDRAGVKEAIELDVRVLPWEGLIDGIVSDVDDRQLSRVARVISGEVVDNGEAGELPDLTSPTPQAQPPIPSRRRRGSSLARR